MTIKRIPFVNYTLDEEKKKGKRIVFTVAMNKQEYAELQKNKKFLQQPKDSTALKQLASIGSKVIHDSSIGLISKTVIANIRRNRHSGYGDVE
ncbi:MAG: hypothetical protein ABH879_03570 [archaeon]